jgi:hypothetical protein
MVNLILGAKTGPAELLRPCTSAAEQRHRSHYRRGRVVSLHIGGHKIFEVNPMNRDAPRRVTQMNDTPRCGARTRAGRSCRCPAMPNGKCGTHGGLSPGAPRGAANGRFTDGYWTGEAIEERRFIRLLLKGTLGGRS